MDSLAVVLNMVMPALFPMCTAMTKLGYVLMGTGERNAILEVSPDGILVCSRNGDNCPHHTNTHVQASKATVHFEDMCKKVMSNHMLTLYLIMSFLTYYVVWL